MRRIRFRQVSAAVAVRRHGRTADCSCVRHGAVCVCILLAPPPALWSSAAALAVCRSRAHRQHEQRAHFLFAASRALQARHSATDHPELFDGLGIACCESSSHHNDRFRDCGANRLCRYCCNCACIRTQAGSAGAVGSAIRRQESRPLPQQSDGVSGTPRSWVTVQALACCGTTCPIMAAAME